MSLNDSHMLPDRVRNMRQMQDVLSVEEIVLAEIEAVISEAYQRASLLHEELINEAWLKEKLENRTSAAIEVSADAEKLLATFILNVSGVETVDMKDVRKFIDKWLPAHLMFMIILLIESSFICPEEFSMIEMSLGFESQFWKVRTLNGTWLLDGSYHLDAVRKPDQYGLRYELDQMVIGEGFPMSIWLDVPLCLQEEMATQMLALGFESTFWKCRTLDGTWLLDGSYNLDANRKPDQYGLDYDCGSTKIRETFPGGLITVKDMWLLNGSYKLDGKKKLDAERREEDL